MPPAAAMAAIAASSHVLAMGFLGASGEVSVETVQTARLHGTVRRPSYGVLRRTAAARANDQIVRAPFCMASTTA
jgi:hypothetical protein